MNDTNDLHEDFRRYAIDDEIGSHNQTPSTAQFGFLRSGVGTLGKPKSLAFKTRDSAQTGAPARYALQIIANVDQVQTRLGRDFDLHGLSA